MIIVGEMNPYGVDPRLALYHRPSNAAGGRLRNILQMSVHSYLSLTRVNLCVGGWSRAAARDAAFGVAALARHHDHATIVMLGRRVATAFSTHLDFFEHQMIVYPTPDHPGLTLALLPHPSGLSRVWNDHTAAPRARQLLRQLEPTLEIGGDS